MRRQGLCDSSLESWDHTDSKNIMDKSRQPRGGTLEHFEICPRKWRKSLYSATTFSKSIKKLYFLVQEVPGFKIRYEATVYVPAYAFFNFLNLISLMSLRGLADFEPYQLNLETRFFSRHRYHNFKGFEPKRLKKKSVRGFRCGWTPISIVW